MAPEPGVADDRNPNAEATKTLFIEFNNLSDSKAKM